MSYKTPISRLQTTLVALAIIGFLVATVAITIRIARTPVNQLSNKALLGMLQRYRSQCSINADGLLEWPASAASQSARIVYREVVRRLTSGELSDSDLHLLLRGMVLIGFCKHSGVSHATHKIAIYLLEPGATIASITNKVLFENPLEVRYDGYIQSRVTVSNAIGSPLYELDLYMSIPETTQHVTVTGSIALRWGNTDNSVLRVPVNATFVRSHKDSTMWIAERMLSSH